MSRCLQLLSFALLLSLSAHSFADPHDPIRVELSGPPPRSQLLRAGQPHFIQGGGGNSSLKALADAGGNSVRTWGTDNLDKLLDDAHSLGLTVTVGIWLGHARHGFDYTNAKQVEDQVDRARAAILKYKDHPAVLMWGIGNEMESNGNEDNAAMWSAVNSLGALAHRLDPNHPTMTVVAEIGGKKVQHIHKLCPEIDIVGINSYGGIASVAKRYQDAGGTKPYVVTEFGPPGTWESGKNAFGVVIELSSTEKATRYAKAWEAIASAKGTCLGGYAFTWGHKQEATATWFGTFLPDGARLGGIDALTEAWTGKPPVNRCPIITSLKVEGADDVEAGAAVHAGLEASDPENDPLKVRWVLEAEQSVFGVGGDAEAAPMAYPEALTKSDEKGADVTMPKNGGAYRLFAYVYDDHGGAAVANVPLHVKGPITLPKAKAATLPLVVYDEADREPAAYVPAGWMGNAKAIQIEPKCDVKPHGGKTCIRCDFTEKTGWGGVVWQSPAGDWGDRPGGFDLTGAKKLTFWARGEKGGESVTFVFGLFPHEKRFFDTASGKLEKVKLTTEWTQYTIDLAGKDLSRIKSGFAWTLAANGEPVTFYLDDIQYE